MPTNRKPLLLAFGLVAVAVFCFGVLLDHFPLRMAAKPIPVLAMVLWVLGTGRGRYGTTIAVGLGLCLLGDVFLELPEAYFLPGMIAFLSGHVAYVVAFVGRTRRPSLLAAVPFALWTGWILAFVWPELGDLAVPVAAYVVVIFGMMWRATALVGDEDAPAVWDWCVMVGAIAFGVSDSLIALDRFHAPIEGVRIPIILLYWGGQILIAASVLSGNVDTA